MEARKVDDRTKTIWFIEPKYTTVEFSVGNLFFFTVKGRFPEFTGRIIFDESDLHGSSVEVTIKAASINTGIKRRDDHLRTADFLDVKKYPDIRFQSTKVEKGRDRDTLRVTGNLTIKGRSREVVLDVEETDHSRSPQGDEVNYYIAQTKINRFDFGVSYGPGIIGRILKVTIQAQALKQ
ncbi:MAG: YceI family protein [Acidobacteria bacterium]|nr:YceI family protein [Acidobacteriota bacterium]